MKTISIGSKEVRKLWGKQSKRDAEYRLMKYVIRADCDDGVLLHNVISGQQLLLTEQESKFLDGLPARCTDVANELIAGYFLVPVDYNEKKTVGQLRAILSRLLKPKGVSAYTILTTTNCNARCFYCYESDLPRVNMSASTADRLVQYMIDHKGKEPLRLHWFGGEPLVGIKVIDQICSELQSQGIRYVSSMTSNGYLFDDAIIERAVKDWRLGSVQITIDGTEKVYNEVKNYIHPGESPYRRVIGNIGALLKKNVEVIIRLNLDMHNADDLQALIKELERTFASSSKLRVYTHVLFEDAGSAPIKRNDETREILYERQNELNAYLESVNFYRPHRKAPSIKTHCCMADTSNATVVFPDGRLFKCEHTKIGDEYGSIDGLTINDENIDKFLVTNELPECQDCPLYPSCILLEECVGRKDKNEYVCSYEINSVVTSLKRYRERKECSSTFNEC